MQNALERLYETPATRRRDDVLLAVLGLLCAVLLLIETGVWQQSRTFKGPFQELEGRPGVLVLSLDRSRIDRLVLDARGDTPRDPYASSLTLTIDGRPATKPNALHDQIGTSAGHAFSHWDRSVLFSLPAGVANDAGTTVTVRYPVRLRGWIMAAVFGLTIVFALHIHGHRLTGRQLDRLQALPAGLVVVSGWVGLGAIGVFAAVTAWGAVQGVPLPTTTIFRFGAAAETAARGLAVAPFWVLILSVLGALAAWSAWFRDSGEGVVRAGEDRVARFAARWGFVLIAALFVYLSSAQWSGLILPGDLVWASLFGLVPFSDAAGYFSDASDSVRSGVWSEFAARRPLAAAFRTAVAFVSDYRFAGIVVVQAALLAGAIMLAAAAVARWRGIWAGLAFAATMVLTVKGYVPTTLTEPLGLVWALLAVPLFVEALRRRSLLFALAALGVMALSLLTRMGAMFAIPAMTLWVAWAFGDTLLQKLKAGVLAAIVVAAAFGTSSAVQKLYATGHMSAGSNFSYTICGISIGTTWDGCLNRYKDELKPLTDEKDVVQFMYAKAAENARSHPGVFVGRLVQGALAFTPRIPSLLVGGYFGLGSPPWFPLGLFVVVCLVGAVGTLVVRREPGELAFWGLLIASTIASAAFVYFDDGTRVLSASYPLLGLFLVMGLAGPREPAPSESASPVLAGSVTAAAGVLLVGVVVLPAVAHTRAGADPRVNLAPEGAKHLVFGGPRLTGVLVVGDAKTRRTTMPVITIDQFERVVGLSGVEQYQPLATPAPPPTPFGFVYGLRVEKGVRSYHTYLVPEAVLTRPEVSVWRFTVEEMPKRPGGGDYWYRVIDAQPVTPPAPRS
ncbi:hypothetical protein [Rhodoplanes azumiensis]|uniref:Glycosyltransferase RgtA/B/C/D-like domain-containing protein n=1 Tax=Rhodoplanes azumiensis TaxID=1897628 RepID=A0ABW5AHF1_9BRAD